MCVWGCAVCVYYVYNLVGMNVHASLMVISNIFVVAVANHFFPHCILLFECYGLPKWRQWHHSHFYRFSSLSFSFILIKFRVLNWIQHEKKTTENKREMNRKTTISNIAFFLFIYFNLCLNSVEFVYICLFDGQPSLVLVSLYSTNIHDIKSTTIIVRQSMVFVYYSDYRMLLGF